MPRLLLVVVFLLLAAGLAQANFFGFTKQIFGSNSQLSNNYQSNENLRFGDDKEDWREFSLTHKTNGYFGISPWH